MFDYEKYFNIYCQENGLSLHLSFEIPPGFETANGMFDVKTNTVFINARDLCKIQDCGKLFYLFHELRHASQYLCPQKFSEIIIKSLQYNIMYDGTCYKLIDGSYKMCKLDGDTDYFTKLYLCQPYEIDANKFAYEQVKNIYGDNEYLKNLYRFWIPKEQISSEDYSYIYSVIDKQYNNNKI